MKKFIAVISAITVMCSYVPVIPENVLNTSAVSVPEAFFVVVGSFRDDVQLKYFGEDSTEKVVWKDAPENLSYGDVLVADGELSMERVQSFPDNPIYAHAYHYELAENTVLDNIGNCSEIAEQKKLTVKDKIYDGSGHWSIHLNDSEGNAYYYGLNTFGSSLGVNPVEAEDGEVCTYSFINGKIIIPLADTDTPFSAETFFVVVGTYREEVQLRYFGEDSIEKVVWKNAPENLSYGDVLVADGEVSMKSVQSMPEDPVYAHAYHYELAEDTVLDNIGNCSEIAEQKKLTVTDKIYDGSGHWSIHLKDSDGQEYYYGLNTFGSSLGVNPVEAEAGEVCTYSFINGKIIIPLAETDTDIMGDTNGDGVFSIADVILLQKWLINSSEDTITDWKKADFHEDGVLDVFDLVIMKQMIVNSPDFL
ncbi:MAG: dockerin type I repeat-containing protein [Ruminococcus sp.]|nr:dockerin type I repeat-containing protein [Ruminococcus sp.]